MDSQVDTYLWVLSPPAFSNPESAPEDQLVDGYLIPQHVSSRHIGNNLPKILDHPHHSLTST